MSSKVTARAGRASSARSVRLPSPRVSPDEAAQIRLQAARAGLPLAVWVRLQLFRACGVRLHLASRPLGRPPRDDGRAITA